MSADPQYLEDADGAVLVCALVDEETPGESEYFEDFQVVSDSQEVFVVKTQFQVAMRLQVNRDAYFEQEIERYKPLLLRVLKSHFKQRLESLQDLILKLHSRDLLRRTVLQ